MDVCRLPAWEELLAFFKRGSQSLNLPSPANAFSDEEGKSLRESLLKSAAVDDQAHEVIETVLIRAATPPAWLEFLKEAGISAKRLTLTTQSSFRAQRAGGIVELIDLGFDPQRQARTGAPLVFEAFASDYPQWMMEWLGTDKVDVNAVNLFTTETLLEIAVDTAIRHHKTNLSLEVLNRLPTATMQDVVADLMRRGANPKPGKKNMIAKVKKAGLPELAAVMEGELLRRRSLASGKAPGRRSTV